MGEHRNMILAIVLAIGILLVYDFFVLRPAAEERRAAAEAAQAELAEAEGVQSDDAPVATAEGFDAITGGVGDLTREQALAASQRVQIQTPSLSGSIALTGARFDDLQLLSYETEVGSGEPVTLFTPEGAEYGHYVAAGWLGQSDGLPGLSTDWTLVEGDVLTPDTPVLLEARAGDLTFQRRITVDESYLFTVEETVINNGAGDVSLQPYGVVRHEDFPVLDPNGFILHEGALGVTGDIYFDRKYRWLGNEDNRDREDTQEGEGGWVGLTTKYWLAAIVPDQDESIRAQFRTLPRNELVFEANYLSRPLAVAAGESLTRTTYVYAGAKDQPVLAAYQRDYDIPRLNAAIDWGMFWFFTQPFFAALHFFYGLLGNYGLAIMVVTLAIKLVLFPLNNRAFASMAKMRAVAPRMQEIRERNKDNPQAQQQAMMELYRKEKINPLAGCLPILPQIPIFFALYKTVFISLDARHAPFFGWITDMSAPDPTSMWNLFGLLPFDPAGIPILGGVLAIGVWPILMGLSMWAQQSLNPPPPDKIQRQIFAFLPIVFTIVLAPFAAALVIYWTWNNFLTILQQYYIMRRQGVTTELDKNIARLSARIKGEAAPVFEDPYAPKTADAAISDKSGEAKGEDGDKATAKPANADADSSPDGDGDDTPPKPTGGKRVTSNPAAKKKRGGRKK
jgi:YidC/Oxa1 family membrane protein insertase